MREKKSAARRRGGRRRKRSYAVPCMIAILLVAAALTAAGHALRGGLLAGLPQYDGAPDIALPLMLLQDSGPLREARARAAWEAEQRAAAAVTPAPVITAAPTEAPPVETAAPTEVPPVETAAPTDVPPAETAAPTDAPFAAVDRAPEPTVPDPERIDAAFADTAADDVPTAPAMSESYFDHTLFIGDSKTDGMRMWGRLGEAQYFCGTNYSVYNIFDKKTSDEAFKNKSLDSVLKSNTYDQIYIILGYNEAGYPFEGLMEQFKYVISRVHKAQPKARIILHGIMHACERIGRKYSYYKVENLETINAGLRALAEEWDGLYYVDCNAPFCDANGYLRDEFTADGEHLSPEHTPEWAQEILRRAVVE